jgi:hypothetical protein
MKRILVGLLVVVFCLVGALAFAAGEQWVVIKDKKGVCKVISAKGKTPKTIAGPFPSKAKAMAAKEAKCPQKPKATKKKSKSKTK